MPIQLNDDYRIEKDKYNWILQQRRVTDPNHPMAKSDSPQEKWVDIGYFGKIEHLVNRLISEGLKDLEVNTFREFLTSLHDIEKRLTTRIKELV